MRSALLSNNAATTSAPPDETLKHKATKKEKSPDKLAKELVQKGALKIVEADALEEHLIANGVYLAQ